MIKYCIHLEHRTDRKTLMDKEFSYHDMQVNFFPAIRRKPGWMGCRDSHLTILKYCKDHVDHPAYYNFLVLEDDVELAPNWQKTYADAMIFDTPDDWDMIYLGLSPQSQLKKHNDSFYIAKNSLCAHAIIYNNKTKVVDYILNHTNEIRKIDVFYKDVIQEQFNCYAIWPILATQYQTSSDTCSRSDLSTIVKNYYKFT